METAVCPFCGQAIYTDISLLGRGETEFNRKCPKCSADLRIKFDQENQDIRQGEKLEFATCE